MFFTFHLLSSPLSCYLIFNIYFFLCFFFVLFFVWSFCSFFFSHLTLIFLFTCTFDIIRKNNTTYYVSIYELSSVRVITTHGKNDRDQRKTETFSVFTIALKTRGAIPCSVDQLTRSRKDRGRGIVHISSRRIRARGRIERDDRFKPIRSKARSQTGTRNAVETAWVWAEALHRCIRCCTFNCPKRHCLFSLCYLVTVVSEMLYDEVFQTRFSRNAWLHGSDVILTSFLLFAAIIFGKYCNINTSNKCSAHGTE